MLNLVLTIGVTATAAATTHSFDWISPLDNGEAGDIEIIAGDIVNIHWNSTGVMEHNVWEITDAAKYADCDTQDNSAMVDLKEEGFVGSVDVKFEAPGVRYFICQITGHCSANQKLRVTVKAAESSPPTTDDATDPGHRLYSADCAPKGGQVGCMRVAGCAWTGEQASSGKCHLIDCAAQATCEDCAYKGCGWQMGKCQDVPGGSRGGGSPCPIMDDASCWTVPDQGTWTPVSGFCTDDGGGGGSSALVAAPALVAALVTAGAAVFA